MKKVQADQNIFYFDIGFKPNSDIIGITVSMQKHHDFEIIFNSNNVMNIQDVIGKRFGSRENS